VSDRGLNIATIGVLITATAGFIFGLMLPRARVLGDETARVTSEQQTVSDRQREVGDISNVYLDMMKLSKDVSSFRDRLPSDRRFGEFLNDLSDAMVSVGITEYHVQPLPNRRVEVDTLPERLRVAEGTGIVPIKLAFRSEFQEVFELLAVVEALPRLVYVEKIDIETVDEVSGQLNVTLVVQAFQYDHKRLMANVPTAFSLDGATNKQ